MPTRKNGIVVNENINSAVTTMTYCTFQRIENIISQLVHHVLLRLVHSVTGFGVLHSKNAKSKGLLRFESGTQICLSLLPFSI